MTKNRENRHSVKNVFSGVLSVVLICAMVLGLCACTPEQTKNATPEELFQSVEGGALSAGIGNLLGYYELLRGADLNAKTAAEGRVSVNLSTEVQDLLNQVLGKNMDLSWINDLYIDVKTVSNGMVSQFDGTIGGTAGAAVSASMVLDYENGKMYVSIPELSQKVLLMDLGTDASAMQSAEAAFALLNQLPDGQKLTNLLTKYVVLAVGCIDDVEKESVTLDANGVEQKCTALEAEISLETIADMLESVLKTAKKDDDLKALLGEVADLVAQQSGQTVDKNQMWTDFCEAIDSVLDSMEADKDAVNDDTLFTWTTYIDGDNQVIGRCFEVEDAGEFFYAKTSSGDKFGFEMYIKAAGSKVMSIEGEGTEKNNVLDASYDLVVEDQALFTVAVDDFDMKKAESGVINGKFKLIPSGELMEQLGITSNSGIGSLLGATLALELECKGDAQNQEVTLSISSAAAKLISITISAKQIAATDIQIPGNTVGNAEQWMNTLDTSKLAGILQKLGVPDSLFGGAAA